MCKAAAAPGRVGEPRERKIKREIGEKEREKRGEPLAAVCIYTYILHIRICTRANARMESGTERRESVTGGGVSSTGGRERGK